ncbi:MAG: hypothetical protein UC749_04920 [Ruminococcus sp.]|uniref:hypothetical protein n=2 Tax=Clostridia TaxID=186801 RepID=UPI001FAB388D|nr:MULTISPECIES: hypothetical protein [Clostridia]MEE0537779.1 hypothetical protein [Ruminococcus sp.]
MVRTMAKTIVTQFGEFLNYANIVKIGVETNWDDAEIDEENGTIKPDFEMIGTDTAGNKIPMGIYDTPDEADNALKALHDWLSTEAYAVYEITGGDA